MPYYISTEKFKIISSLEDIEKEEPASDEQVQQFEDCEEQIVIATEGISYTYTHVHIYCTGNLFLAD